MPLTSRATDCDNTRRLRHALTKQEEERADVEETERWKLGENITISIVGLGYIRSSSISRLDTIDFEIRHDRLRDMSSMFAEFDIRVKPYVRFVCALV